MMRPEKLLLVEGKDDKWAIINLLQPHIDAVWDEKNHPIEIEDGQGDKLFKKPIMSARFKDPNTNILGIVLDADENCLDKWKKIEHLCREHVQDIPKYLPQKGLVIPSKQGRFGVWIMPDNQHPGMLETFLKYLVPKKYHCLLSYAEMASKRAKSRFGAQYGNTHYDKAVMHTWLAWMEPPGKPFGTALSSKILNWDAEMARPFLNWLIDLYELNDRATGE